MKIAVGDRVRALEDCRMAGRGPDRYYYRKGDTGSVVRFIGQGAWVKWDNNHIDDGVWYADTKALTLIEEAEANTYSALSGRIWESLAVVVDLANAAVDAAELLESVAPHHPQTANLRAALAQQPAPVAPVGVEAVVSDMRRWVQLVEASGPYAAGRTVVVQEWANQLEALAQQPAALDGESVEQVASEIAIEDTGVSWHDVSPRDRTHYVKLARAALAAIARCRGGAA